MWKVNPWKSKGAARTGTRSLPFGSEKIPLTRWTKSRRKQTVHATSWSTSFLVMECKIWKLNSQTGDKTKYNTIITNNSTHDPGIQLTGCIVFQQKARGSIFASLCLCFAVPTVFVRFHRDFVSVGKSAEKTNIEKSKWNFPKTIPRWVTGRCSVAVWGSPAPVRNWKCRYNFASRRAGKRKREAWKQHLPRSCNVFDRGGNVIYPVWGKVVYPPGPWAGRPYSMVI